MRCVKYYFTRVIPMPSTQCSCPSIIPSSTSSPRPKHILLKCAGTLRFRLPPAAHESLKHFTDRKPRVECREITKFPLGSPFYETVNRECGFIGAMFHYANIACNKYSALHSWRRKGRTFSKWL
ncbi:hypothetical protein AVEN_127443-1 [Araneus ventricosus]|uniref:Uncharacterized protein n=1 Tax=Araneus ventricosus TaxID=182803 RepID=A0A4Y2EXD6_ARAVE|nr:hypothetical protein AVEN_127443-1 [Araneus ventricosus]